MKRVCVAILLAVLMFSACGPAQLPTGGATAEDPVAASQIHATPLVEGVLPSAPPVVTETLAEGLAPLPTPTLPLTDAVPMWGAEPYRVPVPDFDVVTVPELDNIRFVNPRLLPVSKEQMAWVGTVYEVWTPNNSKVLLPIVAEKSLGNGLFGDNLYQWHPETNRIDPWLENAQNLSWSADGEALYYLSKRVANEAVFFDLYRRDLRLEQSELVRLDLGVPLLNQSPVALSGPDGTLIVVDHEQPALLLQQGDTTQVISLLRLPETQPNSWRHSEISMSPTQQMVAVLFSSKDAHVIYLVDLKSLEVIAQIESDASFWNNVDWSADGQRLAVADSTGVFIYDLAAGDKRYLVTREDMEFPPILEFGGLLGSGADFVTPKWSPDEKVLLFVARCGLWAPGPTERPGWEPLDVSNVSSTEIVFATTSDGAFRRPLSRKSIPWNFSPNGDRALISSWDENEQSHFLVGISWQ